MRSPRPAPRAYLDNPTRFGTRQNITWRTPPDGSARDLRAAQLQHRIIRALAALRPRGTWSTLAAAGTYDRRRWSAWVTGSRWMPPDARTEAIEWLTTQITSLAQAATATDIDVNSDCRQPTLTNQEGSSAPATPDTDDTAIAPAPDERTVQRMSAPQEPSLAQLVHLVGLDRADDPLAVLAALQTLLDATRRSIADQAREARTAGATWTTIGHALGVSRQAAHQAYGKSTPPDRRTRAPRPSAPLDSANPGPSPGFSTRLEFKVAIGLASRLIGRRRDEAQRR